MLVKERPDFKLNHHWMIQEQITVLLHHRKETSSQQSIPGLSESVSNWENNLLQCIDKSMFFKGSTCGTRSHPLGPHLPPETCLLASCSSANEFICSITPSSWVSHPSALLYIFCCCVNSASQRATPSRRSSPTSTRHTHTHTRSSSGQCHSHPSQWAVISDSLSSPFHYLPSSSYFPHQFSIIDIPFYFFNPLPQKCLKKKRCIMMDQKLFLLNLFKRETTSRQAEVRVQRSTQEMSVKVKSSHQKKSEDTEWTETTWRHLHWDEL